MPRKRHPFFFIAFFFPVYFYLHPVFILLYLHPIYFFLLFSFQENQFDLLWIQEGEHLTLSFQASKKAWKQMLSSDPGLFSYSLLCSSSLKARTLVIGLFIGIQFLICNPHQIRDACALIVIQ